MLRTTGILVVAVFLLTSIGLSQDSRFDLSLNGGPVIPNTIGEYSGAYVFSFLQSERVEPFVFAGAAALIFYPGYGLNTVNDLLTNIPASQQTKPAFLYGGG